MTRDSRDDGEEKAVACTRQEFFALNPQFLERPEIWWRISSAAWKYSQLFGWVHVSHPGRGHKPQAVNSKIEEIFYAMTVKGKTVQDVAGRKMRTRAAD